MTITPRRFAVAVVLAACLAAMVAPTAEGAPVTRPQDRALIRVTDLDDHYGHVTRSYTEDLGKGRRPTVCENPVTGQIAAPTKTARSALLKEIAFPANVVWQNTAFYYASALEAQAAFRQMAAKAKSFCNMSKVINIGTDGDRVMARVTYSTRGLVPTHGISRLAVSYDTDLVSSSSPSATYADAYDYSVYAIIGNVITRVGVGQVSRILPLEKDDAESTALTVARRLAKLSS